MARAKTKAELIEFSNTKFEKLINMINEMNDEQINEEIVFDDEFLEKNKENHWNRDKNLKDILFHLYEWHMLLLNWINSNENKEKKQFLPDGYNWKNYGEMNIKFWEKHKDDSYLNGIESFKKTHYMVMEIIEKYNDEELFTKKYYDWTGTTSLGSYIVSATSSHYDWAIKKLKKAEKFRK